MKTNTLRLMTFGAIATLVLASCNKNNGTGGDAPENGFRAIIEQTNGSDGSRTYIDPQSWANGTTDLLWTANDFIKVANNGGASGCQTLTYQLTDGAGKTNGTFYTGEEHETFFTPDYVAIYPIENEAGTANTLSGTTATFNLPDVQTYKENSFAEKSMPMVAYSSDQTLPFKNVLGGICFPIVCASPVQVTSVVLTSAANEALWGTCTTTISTSGGDPTSQVTNSDAAKNVITLDCSGSTVTLSSTPTYFCIMVPPGSLANGFTLQAYSGSTKVFEKSNNNNLGADFIPRSVIRKVSNDLSVTETLTVTTISPTSITTTSAKGLGAVSGMLMGTPSEYGILYAKASYIGSNTPANVLTYANVDGTNVIKCTSGAFTAGTDIANYEADMTGLDVNTVYYVRAYAKNNIGTLTYGDDCIPFATRRDYFANDSHQGVMRNRTADGDANDNPFEFSVSASKKVYFSMGNLQYIGSAGSGSADDNNAGAYWKFADYQFEYFGDNGQGSDAIKQDRDIFGWGTSGINDYTPIATCWQPWSTIPFYQFYYPYGAANTNLNSNSGKADWGYNAISNGGNTLNSGWCTLQGSTNGGNTAEWNYLFNARNCGFRYAQVQLTLKGTSGMSYTTVNGVPACGTPINGVIVFPDNFTWPTLVNILTTLNAQSPWSTNKLTEAQWSLLEQAGAIFLPAAGYRHVYTICEAGFMGHYWSSTYWDQFGAYYLRAESNWIAMWYGSSLDSGLTVRLVCPAE